MNAAVKELDELGVARAIRDGGLPSPQRYGNTHLVAMRITGTGAVYRNKDKELAWRPPEYYLCDAFLERIQGLPIIWDHPKEKTLTSEEYARRVIGSVMLPYIRGAEIWCIGRVNDEDAAQALATERLSTSPAVVLGDDSRTVKLSDGKEVLVEGAPKQIDHLAICGLGAWDHGGPPRGVRVDSYKLEAKSLEQQIRELAAHIPRPLDNAARERIAIDAERADRLAQAFGLDRPYVQALAGESELDARARLAQPFTRYSKTLKGTNLSTVQDRAALNSCVSVIYADAERALRDPATIGPGVLREVVTRDEFGRTTREFHGDPSVWFSAFSGPLMFGRLNRFPGGSK